MREDFVKRAVAFLRHPKVTSATVESKLAFLKGKQLTQEEIDEAFKRTAAKGTTATQDTPAANASAATTTTPAATLQRYDQKDGRSQAVVTGGLVYLSGQAASAKGEAGDAGEQAVEALGQVQRLLEARGSGKDKVVLAQLFVRDIAADFEKVDRAWREWVGPGEVAPARLCVQGAPPRPRQLVEVQVFNQRFLVASDETAPGVAHLVLGTGVRDAVEEAMTTSVEIMTEVIMASSMASRTPGNDRGRHGLLDGVTHSCAEHRQTSLGVLM